MTTRDALIERLTTLKDSILLHSHAHAAPPDLNALVLDAASSTDGTLGTPGDAIVEPFDGGALVLLPYVNNTNTFVVALVGPDGVDASVVSDDSGEVDALYAGLAEQLGLLNETCEGCSTPIPIVYQVCTNCS
jgi:hypothetical protein